MRVQLRTFRDLFASALLLTACEARCPANTTEIAERCIRHSELDGGAGSGGGASMSSPQSERMDAAAPESPGAAMTTKSAMPMTEPMPPPAPTCGNGRIDPGEQCDPRVATWNASTCDPKTCETFVYAACDFDTQAPCPAGWFCGPHEGCTRNCRSLNDCAFPGFRGVCLRFENTDPNGEDFYDCALECPVTCPEGTRCVTWDTYTICGQNTFP